VSPVTLPIHDPSLGAFGYSRSISLSKPQITAFKVRSSSRSIKSPPKDRLSGCPQNSPIRSAQSESGRSWTAIDGGKGTVSASGALVVRRVESRALRLDGPNPPAGGHGN